MSALTKEQRAYLDGRISALRYPARATALAKTHKAEPVVITQARAKVRAYDKEQEQRSTAAGQAADKLLDETRQVVLFGTAEQALAAVKKLEALA